MKHLLDVNVLVALAHGAHPGHARAEAWLVALPASAQLATCSITEIGFVRVSLQTKLCDSVTEAKALLAAMLTAGRFTRLADELGANTLPSYVKTAKETTDGHLLALAKHASAKLATFDDGIPGAELIR
jgi:toxin-antitoxin system PIN domain toxin